MSIISSLVAPVLLLMLQTQKGKERGVGVHEFIKGEVYETEDLDLASVFINNGWAVQVEADADTAALLAQAEGDKDPLAFVGESTVYGGTTEDTIPAGTDVTVVGAQEDVSTVASNEEIDEFFDETPDQDIGPDTEGGKDTVEASEAGAQVAGYSTEAIKKMSAKQLKQLIENDKLDVDLAGKNKEQQTNAVLDALKLAGKLTA